MLYKYLPSARVDVLKNLKIRFSPFESLNDPFEALPLFDSKDRQYIIDEMVNAFESGLLKDKNHDDNYKDFIFKVVKVFRQNLEDNQLSPKVFGHEMMKKIEEQIGILSLSRTESSLLMWSHYAENGKGFVLGFDSENSFFSKENGIERPVPVTYSEKRRIFDISKHNIQNHGNIPKIFCRKPLEWAYEEEERFIRLFDLCGGDIDTGKIDDFGKKIILTSIPLDAIKCVYIGYKSRDKTREDIVESIKKNKITCRVYESSMCDREYKLIFNEIKI
jgi:hypothetical protein